MGATLDLRVQKTYAALMSSFSELLRKKGFEKITVNEICDTAQVRRATFYKHFADKYELFAFIVRDIQSRYIQKENEMQSTEEGIQQYITIFENFLDFLEENQDFVKLISKSELFPVLFDIIFSEIAADVKTRLYKDMQSRNNPLMNTELNAEIFTGMLFSVCKWVTANQQQYKKEAVLKQVGVMLEKIYYS